MGQLVEGRGQEGDEGRMDEDSSGEKGPEIEKENSRIADALGVDWSQLMEQEKEPRAQTGVARRNWTGAQIIRQVKFWLSSRRITADHKDVLRDSGQFCNEIRSRIDTIDEGSENK